MLEKLMELIIGRVLTRNQRSACVAFFFSLIFFVPVLLIEGTISLPASLMTLLAFAGGALLVAGIVLLFLRD